MRKFEKISFNEFKKSISEDKKFYEEYKLPERKTKTSAGYDICSLENSIIKPGKSKAFKTGLKASMESDEAMLLIARSSFGYKYDVTLTNSVGLIDSDYYNNEDNEGHFQVKLTNHGDKDFEVKVYDRIAQAVFIKYLTVDDEKEVKNIRKGGLGSTNKGE